MKGKFYTIFLSIICAFIVITSNAQNVSLNLGKVTVKAAISEIQKQSGYSFVFASNDFDVTKKVEVNASSLEEAVSQVIAGQDVTYKIQPADKKIIISQVQVGNSQSAQSGSVAKGMVSDNTGPIIGGSIFVKGTNKGTVTDNNGRYSLSDVNRGDILVFSCIGYTTKEEQWKGADINVVLEENAEMLEDVVVVGYGTQRKEDMTGAITSLKEDDLSKGVTTNAFQLLAGKASGVNVTQSSSAPGASTKIQIRGAGSINSSNTVLVVVDGLPGVDASSINSEDIESVEILKDASAAAIYGTRAANGVVLITTKSGSEGRVITRFGAELALQSVAKKIDVLNATEYMETLNSLREEAGGDVIFSDDQIASAGEGTNWQDEIFRDIAPVKNINLSISGGGKNSKYYFGLNYFDQDGLVKRSDITKYNIRANMNFNAREWLRFKINMNYTRSDGQAMYENFHGVNEGAGPINSAIQFDPTLPTGKDPSTGRYYSNSYIALDNPLALINGITRDNRSNNAYGTFLTEIEPIKNLVVTARLGASINSYINSSYRDKQTIQGLAESGIASKTSGEGRSWLAEFFATYKYNFADIHKLTIMAGTTFEQFDTEYVSGQASTFLSDALSYNYMQAGDTQNGDDVSSYRSQNRLHGIIGRVNYELYDKYLLTASFRYDGTSRFSEDHKYAFFPSVALAWRITQEPFMQGVGWLSNLKLRAGYGQLGNQGIGNYQTLNTLIAGGSAVFGNTIEQGVVQARIPNTDLKWETTEEYNVGIDYGFLGGRINGTVDFYIRDTKNQLFDKSLPSSIGFSSIKVNAGKVRNSGVDFNISSFNIDTKDWTFKTDLNVSFLRNKVKELPDFMPQLITGSMGGGYISSYNITKEGEAIYSYYGYKITGIFQDEEQIANSNQKSARPGEPIFEDANGDNVIDSNDRQILGKPFPDWTIGITNSLRWKNLTFSIFINGMFGISTLDANVLESLYPTNEYRNRMSKYYKNRWTTSNHTNKYPSGVNNSRYGGQYAINSLTIVSADYLRIKNISLTYNIPIKENRFISAMNVYGAIDNLATITNYDGYDPEASANGSGVSKVNYNSYPAARIFRFGFNLTF